MAEKPGTEVPTEVRVWSVNLGGGHTEHLKVHLNGKLLSFQARAVEPEESICWCVAEQPTVGVPLAKQGVISLMALHTRGMFRGGLVLPTRAPLDAAAFEEMAGLLDQLCEPHPEACWNPAEVITPDGATSAFATSGLEDDALDRLVLAIDPPYELDVGEEVAEDSTRQGYLRMSRRDSTPDHALPAVAVIRPTPLPDWLQHRCYVRREPGDGFIDPTSPEPR